MTLHVHVRSEVGAVGPAFLLGLVGAVLGALLGFIGGDLVASTACSMGDNFECTAVLLVIFTVPGGALVGAVAGAVIGARRPRASDWARGTDMAASSAVQREAASSSWLAVVGGLATAYGAVASWRTFHFSAEELGRYTDLLTPGPEGFGFLGGVFVFVAGTLRTLRPPAAAPTVIMGLGVVLATVGLAWGAVDLADVPSRLHPELLPGFWWSLVGAGASMAAWLVDRRARSTIVPAA